MLRRLLLLVAWVFWPSYCFSESIAPYYGTTGNAAADNALRWSMGNVLPEPPGVSVNGVIYSYTPEKITEDDFKVTVGNERIGGGDIWSDTQDWSGKPGGIEVRRVIGLPGVPKELWGDGYIETEGTGTVNDATVIYSYKVDPCYDPQFDPNCPGYKTPMPPVVEVTIDLYDATKDENVKLSSEEQVLIEANEEQLDKEKEEEEKEAEEKLRKYRLERAMSAADASAIFAENIRIQQMNSVVQLAVNAQYLGATIPGGVYKETVVLKDAKIDDNKQGLRNGLAQQLLHEQLVQSQYE
jgi:hypothetical protein